MTEGVDARTGLVHTAGVTTGKVHDAKAMDNLVREDDRAVFADKGYVNEKKKQAAPRAGVYWAVKEKPKAARRLSSSQLERNRRHGAQVFALLALANLFLARRCLRCA